jgi:tight adherence protein C
MPLARWLCRRGILAFVALFLFVAPAYADDAQFTITKVRATAFPSITARFTVSSARGAPIPVLRSDDFAVEEGGHPIASVSSYSLFESPTPLAIVIALDVSGSMNDEGKLDGAKRASKTFIAQLRSVDRVEVLSFNDAVQTVVPFTNDKKAVAKGIDALVAKGDTALYDATDHAVSDVLRANGTRVVIVLTDGEDTASKAKLAGALDLAKQTEVPIYTIGLGSDASDTVLTRISDETSGRYFKAPRADDLAGIFKLLAQDVANQYELTYFSPLPHTPGKKVDVVVRAAPAGYAPVEGQFTYIMPPVISHVVAPVDPGVLQVVDDVKPVITPVAVSASMFTPEQGALIAVGAVLALLVGLSLQLTKDPREARLATFVAGVARPNRKLSGDQSGGRLFTSMFGFLARFARGLLPAQQVEQLRHNLVLAGNPNGWGVEQFLGVRMLLAIAFAGVGYLYGISRGPSGILLGAGVLGVLGFLLPAIWLGGKMRSRQRLVFLAMPNALDLIAVTVEAGLGFDQAVAEVCQKWQNELTREFALFLSELQLGRNRREALHGIIERTGVPELSGFVGAVIQADELGTGIARTLTVQAEQVRMKRRQHAEKLAHQATIKMMFPLVFLIFPAIFVVILGPAVPTLLQSFGRILK